MLPLEKYKIIDKIKSNRDNSHDVEKKMSKKFYFLKKLSLSSLKSGKN